MNEGNRKRRMVRPSIDETSASVVSTRKGGGEEGKEGKKWRKDKRRKEVNEGRKWRMEMEEGREGPWLCPRPGPCP